MSKINLPVVDVRDLAFAHLQAIERGQDGQRYLVCRLHSESLQKLSKLIVDQYSRFSVKKNYFGTPWAWVWFMSFFSNNYKRILPVYDRKYRIENDLSYKDLDISYRDSSESIIDMVENLKRLKYIENLKE